MRERNGSSETGKYLDRNQEAAEKTALSGGYDLLSHPPIFTFKIENESIVVCEPKSKDVEDDTEKKESRPRGQQNAESHSFESDTAML